MQVRFASYNVAKFEHPQAVAATVREVSADVLALQEVPSAESLDAFAADYPHREFFKTNDPRGHHMALLSKHPVTSTESHRDGTFVRGVGEAEVQIGGFPCRVYTTHLKADPFHGKPYTQADVVRAQERRSLEFGALTGIVAEDLPAMPARRYVVAGDMNAGPAEVQGLLDTGLLSDPLAASAEISHPPTSLRRDYLLASPAVDVVSSGVHDTPTARAASDHLPVVLTLELPDR